MKKYDIIVCGSGISGLTMSLLMAKSGKRVLLVEKAPEIGGSIARFRRAGVPFDIGFHFTGGLEPGGILQSLINVLGLRDSIEPIFLNPEATARFSFLREGLAFDLPCGYEQVTDMIVSSFPKEEVAIRRYFAMVKDICIRTPSMDLSNESFVQPRLKEDFISLQEALEELTPTVALRGLLSGYAMCYGVRPSEISFANHARMVMNFYESLAYVKGGGDAFIEAFKRSFEALGVDVMTNTEVTRLDDIRDERVHRFALSDGSEVEASQCVFTMHPLEIAKLLPREHFRKAFYNRVDSFEPSVGFFSVFATLSENGAMNYTARGLAPEPSIISVFPHADVDGLLDPESDEWPGMVFIRSVEEPVNGKRPVHLLEPVYPQQAARWQDTHTGKRPSDYEAYKKEKLRVILEKLYEGAPRYKGLLDVVGTASTLTYRDYLMSPDGSAYGVRQKIGQFNVAGKLSLGNLYVAGQSAILPGVIGAMLSSFIVARLLIEKPDYDRLLKAGA